MMNFSQQLGLPPSRTPADHLSHAAYASYTAQLDGSNAGRMMILVGISIITRRFQTIHEITTRRDRTAARQMYRRRLRA